MRPAGLRYAYGTNGLADHRLPEALALLGELGYDGVALTLDVHHLDPFAPDVAQDVAAVRALLDRHGLGVVIETGGRYVLDPRRKHRPTLLGDGRDRRLDLLHRAIDIGADLDAEAVSFWSGALPDGVPPTVAWDRLVAACRELLDHARGRGVQLALEPEPGMLVAHIAGYERLAAALGGDPRFGITLDLGHCKCLEERPVPDCVRAVAARLVNVQIEDMVRGVHEHLPLGDGDIEFPPVLAALREVGYDGLVGVELPRHSHAGAALAARSIDFLRAAERTEQAA